MKNKYQKLVNQTIPVSNSLGWKIDRLSLENIVCKVELLPNINIHGTGFAGSIYAVGMATGWTLLKCWSDAHQFENDLVAAEANIQYIYPVTDNFECSATFNPDSQNSKKLIDRLKLNKTCGFPLQVQIECNANICAILTIQFVFKKS